MINLIIRSMKREPKQYNDIEHGDRSTREFLHEISDEFYTNFYRQGTGATRILVFGSKHDAEKRVKIFYQY